MEDQCSWGYWYQEEGMQELKQTLLFTTLELETTLISAKEETARRELELIHLRDVLTRTMKERDEAQCRCQKLMLEKFILQQQLQQKEQKQQQVEEQQQETASLSGVSSYDDEPKSGDSNQLNSSSDSNRSTISSPPVHLPLQLPQSPLAQEALKLAAKRPLPEKGKLLQAVKDAGPLLQNLLLAGPLPQWQHPPPQLTSVDIPPVAISSPKQHLINQDPINNFNGCLSKKRVLENFEGSDCSPNNKYQKALIH
ncbi:hypothetical protein DITRI_Ditri09bG0096600 [Diplodiscus trichospermus]